MDKKPDDVVLVPRWALEFILANASFDDDSDCGVGWPTEKMKEAREAVEKAMVNYPILSG